MARMAQAYKTLLEICFVVSGSLSHSWTLLIKPTTRGRIYSIGCVFLPGNIQYFASPPLPALSCD